MKTSGALVYTTRSMATRYNVKRHQTTNLNGGDITGQISDTWHNAFIR
jgi:hypothetical protein